VTLVDSGILYRRYDETTHKTTRLGRHMWLDGRSLPYMVERQANVMGQALVSKQWERIIPILDQGQLGSCCPNAGTGALGTQPFYDKVGKVALGPRSNSAQDDERFAVHLYSDATKVDPFPGSWPPVDTGTAALAIAKVLKTRGTISGYQWARSALGLLQLLQTGPVLIGMPWHEAFFSPDQRGFIDSGPHWSTSGIAGGHEIEAVGVDIDAKDLSNSVITACNSWGSSWSDVGRFRFRLSLYDQLHSVDLLQFVA
jgi:hypothetical protein